MAQKIESTKQNPETKFIQDLDEDMHKWNKNEITTKLSNQDTMETKG